MRYIISADDPATAPVLGFVPGNVAATVHDIASYEVLFRIGIFSDLLTALLDIFVVLALYRLLNAVDRTLATFMVIFGFADVPIYFINSLNDVGALLFARGADLYRHLGNRSERQ